MATWSSTKFTITKHKLAEYKAQKENGQSKKGNIILFVAETAHAKSTCRVTKYGLMLNTFMYSNLKISYCHVE